jgi:predicted nucleic acid-binding Zn ribbon protein
MPTFRYKCDNTECDFEDEYITHIPSCRAPEFCPECKDGTMEKQLSMKGQSFDCPGGYDYEHGKKAWKKNMSQDDQAKVLQGLKDPY